MPQSGVLKAAEQEIQSLRKTLQELNIEHERQFEVQQALERDLKKSLKWEKLSKHLIQLMNRSFEPDIIIEIIVQELGVFFNVDRCLVILCVNGEGGEQLNLFAQYCRNETISSITQASIPWHDLGRKQREIYPSDLPDDLSKAEKAYLANNHIESAITIEIRYRRVIFGRLILQKCVAHHWTEQEISFQDTLATHIGSALYQSKLYHQEKQAKQEAEEANQQKSKVLAFVSHDFKNPLSSIDRFIHILEDDKSDILSGKHREFTGYIAEGISQLRRMVINILDKCRLAEGKVIPAPEWIELPPFLNEISHMFTALALQKNIEINLDIQYPLSRIKADPTHLRQIIINLLSNAIKYNRKNGKVFLRFYIVDETHSFIIEVEDTGPGIAPEKIPKLFVEYFRGDLSQLNLVEGSGLGLAFIKKLIELNGGNITVHSEEKVGTTFKVKMPLNLI